MQSHHCLLLAVPQREEILLSGLATAVHVGWEKVERTKVLILVTGNFVLGLAQGGNAQLGEGQLLVLIYNSSECVALNALHKQPLIHDRVSFLSLQPVATCHPSSTPTRKQISGLK